MLGRPINLDDSRRRASVPAVGANWGFSNNFSRLSKLFSSSLSQGGDSIQTEILS